MDLEKIWYICDPRKANSCNKRTCASNPKARHPVCNLTSHAEWSVRDEFGTPILYLRKNKMPSDKTLESIEEKLSTFLDVITSKASYYTLKPKDMFLYAKAFEAITQTILQVRLIKSGAEAPQKAR